MRYFGVKKRSPDHGAVRDAEAAVVATAEASLEQLQLDPDIREENAAAGLGLVLDQDALDDLPAAEPVSQLTTGVRLNVVGRTHQPSEATARLLEEVGGVATLERFTNLFYEKAFADPHIDSFIRDHNDPHGARFAKWIAEKLGGDASGRPWSRDRMERPAEVVSLPGAGEVQVHDRSSAHYAAWHSPKRAPEKVGDHFQLDDCRIWMRLHFWAARESGAFDHPGFQEYYVKFIGHFVSVYERTAPAFARESARWSEDAENIRRYLEAGREMGNVKGLSYHQAISALPIHERPSMRNQWPYV